MLMELWETSATAKINYVCLRSISLDKIGYAQVNVSTHTESVQLQSSCVSAEQYSCQFSVEDIPRDGNRRTETIKPSL